MIDDALLVVNDPLAFFAGVPNPPGKALDAPPNIITGCGGSKTD
jgi:hypothetical protein